MVEGGNTLDELKISFDGEGVKGPNEENVINVISTEKELKYKFIIGNDGIWNTIQDYSKENVCKWTPKEEGKYMIMVQGKKEGSKKPFDFMTKEEIVVDNKKKLKLIRDVNISKESLSIGEKNTITVISDESSVLYRFWKAGKNGWEPLRDYTVDNTIVFTATEEGKQDILVECKRLNSKEKVDEFTTIRFYVNIPLKTEILDFKCITEERIVNNELMFKVKAAYDDKRSLIYKFIKINKEGKAVCIQDYSSRKTVYYQEKVPGTYKLLCLVRDLLSSAEYDDRAIIVYDVKPYNKINIESFTSDISSPQLVGTHIKFSTEVSGGRELLYRYIVEGPIGEDTGYIRNNYYTWSSREEGKYTIKLLVKDISYKGEYEDKRVINFELDQKSDKPVRIKDIITNNKSRVLLGTPINIKVLTEGGIEPNYSFVVYKNSRERERINYGVTNWVNFTPEESGEYEVDIRVKDKYSYKEYDSNVILKIKAYEYLPSEIDYILYKNNESYVVGDNISFQVLTQDTKNVLVKIITKINGYVVEEGDYSKDKVFNIKPKCPGKYTFEIYAKNVKCKKGYDSKKEINIYVTEALPVRDTVITMSKEKVKLNEEVSFKVESKGGKQVCYEFYIMEAGNWVKVQSYSRKNYYTFIPFLKGKYKIMVMAKSFYKKVKYEDYNEVEFYVE